MEKYTPLMIDSETGDICEYTPEHDNSEKKSISKCKHSVKLRAFKQDYITFCSKCGKILAVRKRKILVKTDEGIKEV